MRILVTGHKGYIGTVMVPVLQAAGHEVKGIDADFYRNSTYGAVPGHVEEVLKDVRDIEARDLNGIDAVVSLAALSNDMLGDLNEDWTYEINYQANVRLADLCRDVGIERFVFASSCSMYGASGDDILDEGAKFHPVTAYAKSKVMVESEVSAMASDRFSPTFMRNATAYGVSPRMRFDLVVNNLTAWAYTTGQVRMKSDGSPWRPLVHIEDISRAVLAVLEAPTEKVHNEAFNIGRNDQNFQIREVASFVRDVVPGCEVSFAEGAEPDLRNYRVNFDKYADAFPDYPLVWTVKKGVEQVYQAYRRIGLGVDDYEGPQFKRIAQLQKLMAEELFDDSLRWRESPREAPLGEESSK